MAGGEGTRLRPLTSNQPKPMLPMANRPMMEHVVRLLRQHGITDIVVTVAFMASAVRNYFGDGSELDVRMVYATEETPLGTAGSVRNAHEELSDRFVVISGDVLTDLDIPSVIAFHENKGAMATLALHRVQNPLEFGIVISKEDGSIDRFLEKPTWGQVFSDTINTGIYVLEPEIFDYIPEGRPVDFSNEVFPAVLDSGHPIYGYVADGYWEDVGTTEAYLRAHQDILDGKVQLEMEGFELRPGVWLGRGATVDPSAVVDGPAVIGDNCSVGAGAVLGEYSVLGPNVRVADSADIRRSVFLSNGYIGAGARVEGAIAGRNCDLRQGVRCEPESVLGEGCLVGAHAQIRPGVKIFPHKTVEAGAIVNSSIIWESRGPRSVFGRDGVRGIANVDIGVELAVRLSMAWASTLDRGTTISVSRDTSRTARVLKRAVMVGCNSVGVNVNDLEVATVPVTRHEICASASKGGITVRLVAGDPQSVVLRFFDDQGLDLSEAEQRKIERLYHREEFRRVSASDIGDITFPSREVEHYTLDLVDAVDLTDVGPAGFKLVLDLSYGAASFVMPNVLAKLQADVLTVNPYAHTAGVMTLDRSASAARVAELVRASGAQLGAVIDPDGEHLTVVDDEGTVLGDHQGLLALLHLIVDTVEHPTVALPVAVSQVAETIVRQAGGEVIPTKMSSANLIEVAASGGISFAADESGGYIIPSFLPAFDAVATLVSLVSMLVKTGQTLSKVVRSLPAVHIEHITVVTPWEQKGHLMRAIVEQLGDRETILTDGVKVVEDDGWALVLPDPEEPLTHVWAEGPSDAAARSRAQQYAVRLRQMLR